MVRNLLPLVALAAPPASAFTSGPSTSSCRSSSPPGVRLSTDLRSRSSVPFPHGTSDDVNYDPCPDPIGEDPNLDRREAAAAMIGRLWAAGALPSAVMGAGAAPANAVYGSDAKIELPNPVQGMYDRTTKQCIVESLGNRECLVYLDEANKVYQGADAAVLLGRIEAASEALATMPDLIADKKWTKVLGVMTGPMGTLGGTMDELAKLGSSSTAAERAKKVKTDLYAIAGAVERKNPSDALKFHGAATADLVEFVKSL